MPALYRAVMFAGSLWCHQIPARSPHLWGAQLPLCWRCSGVLIGAVALLVWLLTKKRLPSLTLSLIIALLMPLDVLHAIISGGDGDNARRLVTGILWGVFGTSALLHGVKSARGLIFRPHAALDVERKGAGRLTP